MITIIVDLRFFSEFVDKVYYYCLLKSYQFGHTAIPWNIAAL